MFSYPEPRLQNGMTQRTGRVRDTKNKTKNQNFVFNRDIHLVFFSFVWLFRFPFCYCFVHETFVIDFFLFLFFRDKFLLRSNDVGSGGRLSRTFQSRRYIFLNPQPWDIFCFLGWVRWIQKERLKRNKLDIEWHLLGTLRPLEDLDKPRSTKSHRGDSLTFPTFSLSLDSSPISDAFFRAHQRYWRRSQLFAVMTSESWSWQTARLAKPKDFQRESRLWSGLSKSLSMAALPFVMLPHFPSFFTHEELFSLLWLRANNKEIKFVGEFERFTDRNRTQFRRFCTFKTSRKLIKL